MLRPLHPLPPELVAQIDAGHALTIERIDWWIREIYPQLLADHPEDRTARYTDISVILFAQASQSGEETNTTTMRLANLAAELMLRAAEHTHDTERHPKAS